LRVLNTTTEIKVEPLSTTHIYDSIVDFTDKPYLSHLYISNEGSFQRFTIESKMKPSNVAILVDKPITSYCELEELSLKLLMDKKIIDDFIVLPFKDKDDDVSSNRKQHQQKTQVDRSTQKSSTNIFWEKIKCHIKIQTLKKLIIKMSNQTLVKIENERKEFEIIKASYQKIIDSLRDESKNQSDEFKEFQKMSDKIKTTFKNLSVNDLADKYVLTQKKLNDLKSQITPIIMKHSRLFVKWESEVKNYGFIRSLHMIIKHFDDEYEDGDSIDYDSYD